MSTPSRDRHRRCPRILAARTAAIAVGVALAADRGVRGPRAVAGAARLPRRSRRHGAGRRPPPCPHRRRRAAARGRHPRLPGCFSVVNELGPGFSPGCRRRAPSCGAASRCSSAGQPVFLLYGGGPRLAGLRPRHDARSRRPRAAAEPGRARVRARARPTASSAGPPRPPSSGGSRRAACRHRRDPARRGRVPAGPLRVTAVARAARRPGRRRGRGAVRGLRYTPAVLVSLTVGGPAVSPGDPVLVTMPDGTTTVPGSVTVGAAASPPSRRSGGGAPGSGGTPPPPSRSRSISRSRSRPALTRRPCRWPSPQQRDTKACSPSR